MAKVTQEGSISLARFVAVMLKRPREGTLSAGDYSAAPDSAQKRDKGAFSWFSLAQYRVPHRNSENWLGTNAAVLDLDASHGIEKGAKFSFTADALCERLADFRFIALPTHSYTDEAPRWRVIIPLSETLTDREEYGAVAGHLSGLLDNYVDQRSLLPEQLWYVMSTPKGEWNNRVSRIVVGS